MVKSDRKLAGPEKPGCYVWGIVVLVHDYSFRATSVAQ